MSASSTNLLLNIVQPLCPPWGPERAAVWRSHTILVVSPLHCDGAHLRGGRVMTPGGARGRGERPGSGARRRCPGCYDRVPRAPAGPTPARYVRPQSARRAPPTRENTTHNASVLPAPRHPLLRAVSCGSRPGYSRFETPRRRRPVVDYLQGQGRYRHLFEPERNEVAIEQIQAQVDRYWEMV